MAMSRGRGAFLAILLLLSISAGAESWSIFVNNKPFKGKVSGKPEAMQLDAAALTQCTSIGLQVDAAAGTVTLNGESVPTIAQNGALLVDAKELAKRVGGKYSVNRDLYSVDVYLMPISTAATNKRLAGKWLVTDAHEGCCSYRKDVTFNVVEQGGTVSFAYPGGYRFKGQAMGATYTFTYSGPGSVSQMGSGSLTLAPDGRTFTGQLADMYGHRAVWTGSRQ
ncbi:MAG: hypothetical protein HY319_02430 [Armatimonadetes bacterium]|nr:hypothetical protein [Armatimonadota bacterium]